MKKVFTLLAIAAAFTFTACNEAHEETTTEEVVEETVTEEAVVEETVVEEVMEAVDSTATDMMDAAEEMVEDAHDHVEGEEHAH